MIPLKKIDGNVIDLSVSPLFMQHYANKNSFAQYILDKEINNGVWYDEILAKLPEDAVIVDAGSNVGLFSLYLNKKGRKLFCIEPSSSHISVAQELFKKLGCEATIWEGVLYNIDGEVRLYADAGNSTMNRVSESGWLVKARTLKSFFDICRLKSVDLLKLDVEGSEWKIIMEDETIGDALNKCKVVFIETHPGFFGNGDNEQPMIDKIMSLGFSHTKGTRDCSHYFIKHEVRV